MNSTAKQKYVTQSCLEYLRRIWTSIPNANARAQYERYLSKYNAEQLLTPTELANLKRLVLTFALYDAALRKNLEQAVQNDREALWSKATATIDSQWFQNYAQYKGFFEVDIHPKIFVKDSTNMNLKC